MTTIIAWIEFNGVLYRCQIVRTWPELWVGEIGQVRIHAPPGCWKIEAANG